MTRSEPGAARTAARLAQLGYEAVVVPLITIRPLVPELPDLRRYEGLVFTSVNGIAAFLDLAVPTGAFGLPVFAVGQVTTRAALEAGFETVQSADGDVEALAGLLRRSVPTGACLLQAGALHPAGDLAGMLSDHAEVHTLAVYEAINAQAVMPTDFDGVLVQSARAAEELLRCLPADQATGRCVIAISPAVASKLAAAGFASIHVAATPDDPGVMDAVMEALGKPSTGV